MNSGNKNEIGSVDDAVSANTSSESAKSLVSGLAGEALQRASACDDPASCLAWVQVAQSIQDREKAGVEIRKLELERQNAFLESRYALTRFFATTLTPVLTVLIAMSAIGFQARQFKETAELQQVQNEDAKWRELVKTVSFADPKVSLVGALAMEAFFDSPRYAQQSRSIAVALLPCVNNVNGFDQVLDELVRRTAANNQYEIVSISSMLSFSARQQHAIAGPTISDSAEIPPFLFHDVTAIDPNPDFSKEGPTMRDAVTAWELDSVSHGFERMWRPPRSLPPDKYLAAAVLENAHFENLDFSNVNLSLSVLLDAHFEGANFSGATLTNASLRRVKLDGADLSGITQFAGSTWTDANWEGARCLSPELFQYLSRTYPQRKIPQQLTNAVGSDCK